MYGATDHDLTTNSVYQAKSHRYVPMLRSANNLNGYRYYNNFRNKWMIVNATIRVPVGG